MMTYQEVVEKAQDELKKKGKLVKRNSNGKVVLELEVPDIWLDTNQINLWAYWQGHQIKDIDNGIDILLVGQDWGNPSQNEGTEERIRLARQNPTVVQYNKKNPTNKMLVKLFRMLDCDVESTNPGKRIFFTNLCLRYRIGSETGYMTKGIILEDKPYFDELVDAIKPKIIICLGKITYEVVTNTKVKDFIRILGRGTPIVGSFGEDKNIKVYGVPHPGSRGRYNVGGEEKMMEIWRKIEV